MWPVIWGANWLRVLIGVMKIWDPMAIQSHLVLMILGQTFNRVGKNQYLIDRHGCDPMPIFGHVSSTLVKLYWTPPVFKMLGISEKWTKLFNSFSFVVDEPEFESSILSCSNFKFKVRIDLWFKERAFWISRRPRDIKLLLPKAY